VLAGAAQEEIIAKEMKRARVSILGASGYTGAELVRLLLNHPRAEIVTLTGESKAGLAMGEVFPHLAPYDLPKLVKIEQLNWNDFDLVFCALPHGTTQNVIKAALAANKNLKLVDLSADFRLSDVEAYARWYNHPHQAKELQAEAVYGMTELYRRDIKKARLVANPGCYTTASILPLAPLLKKRIVAHDPIVIDAKSGVTGAGRAAKEANLFTEVAEGFHAYGVGHHRHMSELDQEFSKAAGREVVASFTPHLLPINRGILATIYVNLRKGKTIEDAHAVLASTYEGEDFVKVLALGQLPSTRHVRGSNLCLIGLAKDRQDERIIIVSALDNLVKGASGQAVQNMNLMLGYDENLGLNQAPLFP
jgi:N-acetyl-gamma-glutamyl-phosphate reductase